MTDGALFNRTSVGSMLRQQGPSEWPPLWRHAFVAGLAGLTGLAVLIGSDALGHWQTALEQVQRREDLLVQRAQHAQALARWRDAHAPAAAQVGPEALLQAWLGAAAQTDWSVLSHQVETEPDGASTVQLQMQGRFADAPRWWSHWQAVAPLATLGPWRVQSLDPDGSADRVRVELTAHFPPTSDDVSAAQPDAGADAFDAEAWTQRHWQHAQNDARVAQWLTRWWAAPRALTQVRGDNLQYLGRLQSAAREVALVRVVGIDAGVSPVHAVAVGDALGSDLGRVIHIDDARVLVQQWRRDPAGVWHAHPMALLRSDAASPTASGSRP